MSDSTIHDLPSATALAGSDVLPIDQGFVTRKTTVDLLSTTIAQTNIAEAIHAATTKTTPVNADEFPLADSADSFQLKKVTFGNLSDTIGAVRDSIAALRLVSKTIATHVFVTGYYASGDGGGGAYWYDSSDTTSVDNGGSIIVAADGGRWKLIFTTVLSVRQFGAKGDGVTDDLIPFQKTLIVSLNTVDAARPSSVRVYVPQSANEYYLSDTLTIGAATIFEGDGCNSAFVNGGSILAFAAETPGIVVQISPTQGGSSVIQHLKIRSKGNLTFNTAAHGIDLKQIATVRSVSVIGFGGNGINADSTTGGSPNTFLIEDCSLIGNGCHGVYTNGGDANAGLISRCSALYNGRYGFCDESFLGNTYIGCHSDANGLRLSGNTTTQVSYGGNWYSCLSSSIDTTTVPGTDPAVWQLISAGGVDANHPLWASGGLYIYGGAYKATGVNQSNVFLGCYSESGQPPMYLSTPSYAVGGTMGAGFIGGRAPYLVGSQGNIKANTGLIAGTPLSSGTGGTFVGVGGDTVNGTVIIWAGISFDSTGQTTSFKMLGKDSIFNWANVGTANSATLTGYETLYTFGRTTTVRHRWMYPEIFLGVDDGARSITFSTAPPTTGEHAVGEKVFNSAAALGQPKGWVCTVAGTSGTLNSGATTGDITTGTTALAVNSATGLYIGANITIAGVTGVKVVTNVVGTAITIDVAADATVTGAAVAYSNPTFESEGNL